MGLFSRVKKVFGKVTGETAAREQRRAAEAGARVAEFRPINIGVGPGGLFGTKFIRDERGRLVGAEALAGDPGVVRAQQQLAAGLPGLLQQRRLDPRLTGVGRQLTDIGRFGIRDLPGEEEAARRELGLFERLRAPGREAQREEVTSRLLAQGRLGTTAGGEVEAALERQFEQQRAADALAAIQSARQAQQAQFQRGLATVGLGTGLLTQQQQARQGLFGQNLQDLLALQQAQLQPIQLGGQLGSAQSAAGANIANILQTGAQQAAGQSIFNPATLASFAQAAGSAGAFSDERLKENIKLLYNERGFNIYEFNYIGNPAKYSGVIAQEIQEVRPDAIGNVDGWLTVDYAKLGLEMRKL